jgi:hypothetical protein
MKPAKLLLENLIKECLEEIESEKTMCKECAINFLQELKANPILGEAEYKGRKVKRMDERGPIFEIPTYEQYLRELD